MTNCNGVFEVLSSLASMLLDLLLLLAVGLEVSLVHLLGIVVESTGKQHIPASGMLVQSDPLTTVKKRWFLYDYRDTRFYKKKGEGPATLVRRYGVAGIFKYHDQPRTSDVTGTVVWYDPLSSEVNVKVKLDIKTSSGKEVLSLRFRDLLYFHALRSFGLIHCSSTVVGLRVFLSSTKDCYMIRKQLDGVMLPDALLRIVNRCRSYRRGSGGSLNGYWLTPAGKSQAVALAASGLTTYWAPVNRFAYTLGMIKSFTPTDPYKGEKRVEVQVDGEPQTRLLWLLGGGMRGHDKIVGMRVVVVGDLAFVDERCRDGSVVLVPDMSLDELGGASLLDLRRLPKETLRENPKTQLEEAVGADKLAEWYEDELQ